VRHPQLISSTNTIVDKWQCLLPNTLGRRNLGGLNKILGFATSPYLTPPTHTILSTLTSKCKKIQHTQKQWILSISFKSKLVFKTNSNIHLTYMFHAHTLLCFSKSSFCISILQSYHIYSQPHLNWDFTPFQISTFVNYFLSTCKCTWCVLKVQPFLIILMSSMYPEFLSWCHSYLKCCKEESGWSQCT
jgi:hypothetical protein